MTGARGSPVSGLPRKVACYIATFLRDRRHERLRVDLEFGQPPLAFQDFSKGIACELRFLLKEGENIGEHFHLLRLPHPR
ncbi:hypothetical protein ACVII1_007247 [Bradyrhizobium elkanii]